MQVEVVHEDVKQELIELGGVLVHSFHSSPLRPVVDEKARGSGEEPAVFIIIIIIIIIATPFLPPTTTRPTNFRRRVHGDRGKAVPPLPPQTTTKKKKMKMMVKRDSTLRSCSRRHCFYFLGRT